MNYKKLLLFGAFFIFASYSYSQVLDQIIVVVGDDMIKQSDVDNQQLLMLQQGEKSEKCDIFKEMVMQKLLVDQAKIDSLEVTDAEINTEIDRRIKALSGAKGGLEQLETFYGKSEIEIRNDWKPVIKDQLLAQKVQNTLIGEVEVSPNDVRLYYMSHQDSMPKIDRKSTRLNSSHQIISYAVWCLNSNHPMRGSPQRRGGGVWDRTHRW